MQRYFSRVPALLQALTVLAALIVVSTLAAHLSPHDVNAFVAGAPLLLGMPVQLGKSYQWLKSVVKPANADQPESVPHVLFDTQLYPQAGTAALTFFNSAAQANASDATLSNFAAGQLDDGYYFEVHRAHMIIHAIPNTNATVAITGAANDVEILHKTARGIFGMRIKGKTYGDFPLAYFGRPGGPVPSYSSYGSGTVANNVITAGETEANGGFPYLGNLVFQPTNTVKGIMSFNSTAISAATNITIALMGVLHRPLA